MILDPARAPDRTHLDLSSDPGAIASYELYPVGGQKIIVHSVPATNGFTTPAQDLVETSGNRLTLVIARTMMLDVVSQAILRGGRLSYSVPTTDAICGREFAFPLESVGRGAWLYIGTPNGSPATGSVHLVNQAGPVIGTIGVDGLGCRSCHSASRTASRPASGSRCSRCPRSCAS